MKRIRKICSEADLIFHRIFRSVSDKTRIEQQIRIRTENPNPLCLLCFRSMEEERNLSWILSGEDLLCAECRQKTGIGRKVRLPSIPVLFFNHFLSRLLFSKKKRTEKPVQKTEREHLVWITGLPDSGKAELSVPCLVLFEENDEFLSLWHQYSERHDYILASVFLQHQKDLCDFLARCDCLAGWELTERNTGCGWDPLAEIFRSGGISLHFLMTEEAGRSVFLPGADLLSESRRSGKENKRRKRRRAKRNNRRKVLVFESRNDQELIMKTAAEIRKREPEFRPDLIVFLY